MLRQWEHWAAEVASKSHLSYPALAYFPVTAQQPVVACLLNHDPRRERLCDGGPRTVRAQAGLTFAMARHTAVDLPRGSHGACPSVRERLNAADLTRLQARLADGGMRLARRSQNGGRLAAGGACNERTSSRWRGFCRCRSRLGPAGRTARHWQTSAWYRRRAASVSRIPLTRRPAGIHF